MKLDIEQIYFEIRDERARQYNKWGEQNHDLPVWITVLSEEVGEASKEVLEYRTSFGHLEKQARITLLRKELVQVAAVAIATIEYMERNLVDQVED